MNDRKRMIIGFGGAFIILVMGILIMSNVSGALQDDIIAYYKMDESSGSNFVDSVGALHNATSFANGGSVIAGSNGILGNSVNITGGGYLNITERTNVCIPYMNCTISMWVNVSKVESQYFWFSGEAVPNDNSIRIGTSGNGSGYAQMWNSDQTSHLVRTGLISNSYFQHIVLNLNTTHIGVFLNGTFQQSLALAGNLNDLSLIENMGNSVKESNAMGGTLDEVGIWNRSLNPSEISELWNDGNALSYPYGSVSALQNYPTNALKTVKTSITFNATLTPISPFELVNTTINLYFSNGTFVNQTTNTITGSVANDSLWTINDLIPSDYIWNVEGCANDSPTVCTWTNNLSFSTTEQINQQWWRNSTTEGNTEFFQLNITIPDVEALSSGNLIYNNTVYAGSFSQIAGQNYSFSRTLDVPQVFGSTILNFTWNITYTSGYNFASGEEQQTVNALSLDSCGANTILILNYTMRDEETRRIMAGVSDNATVSVDLGLSPLGTTSPIIEFNQTFNVVNGTNPAQVCMNSETINSTSYRMDVVTSYSSADHVTEFHHIQNFTLTNDTIATPRNVDLHDLATDVSQEFLISFKDANFLPVSDALFDITRNYIGEGLFRSVEVVKTDSDGDSIAHLVLGDVIYTIQVSKNGVLLASFENVRAYCDDQSIGDCRINLNALSSETEATDFTTADNLNFRFLFDNTLRVITVIFNTLNGATALVSVNGTVFDAVGTTTACSQQVTTSAGTLTCNIPVSVGNKTIETRLYMDGRIISTEFFSIRDATSQEAFGFTGTILLLILYITIPLMFITSGVGIVISSVIGLIFAGILNLYSGFSFVGTTSTIIWLAIAGGILVWKISKRD